MAASSDMKKWLQSLQNNPLTGLMYSAPITFMASRLVFSLPSLLQQLLSSSRIITSSSSTMSTFFPFSFFVNFDFGLAVPFLAPAEELFPLFLSPPLSRSSNASMSLSIWLPVVGEY